MVKVTIQSTKKQLQWWNQHPTLPPCWYHLPLCIRND